MHRAEEDYLKIIYKLTVESERPIVKNNEVSEATGYTDQTVNEMIKRLAKKKMVTYVPYKGVNLTKKGIIEAKRLVKNHRLWEVFLVEKLNYSWTEVHDEAENLEHASSDVLMSRIDAFLNHPDYCVHGNAIPHDTGLMEKTAKNPLSDLSIDTTMTVKRVVDEPKLLNYLDEINIHLGTKITVLEKDDFNGIIKVLINDEIVMLSALIAKKIFGTV